GYIAAHVGENELAELAVFELAAVSLALDQLRCADHASDRPSGVVHDRLPWDPTRRRLAAEPRVHGRADIGEFPLVETTGGVPPFDGRKQERVLPRVVGRRRRRIAAVI